MAFTTVSLTGNITDLLGDAYTGRARLTVESAR